MGNARALGHSAAHGSRRIAFLLSAVAAAIAAISALTAAPAQTVTSPDGDVAIATAVVSEATAVVRQAMTSTPVVSAQVQPYSSSPPTSLESALAASQWPPELWAMVAAVVYCESRGRTDAVAPAGYTGLMQVDPALHGPVPADAVGQLNQAFGVYLAQGWGAWPVCSH